MRVKKISGLKSRDYIEFTSFLICILFIPFFFNWILSVWNNFNVLQSSSMIVINTDSIKTRFLPLNKAATLILSIKTLLDSPKEVHIKGFRAQLIDKSIFGEEYYHRSFEIYKFSITEHQPIQDFTFNIKANLPRDSEIIKNCNENFESEIDILFEILYNEADSGNSNINEIYKRIIKAKINCHAPTIEEILFGLLTGNKRNAQIL